MNSKQLVGATPSLMVSSRWVLPLSVATSFSSPDLRLTLSGRLDPDSFRQVMMMIMMIIKMMIVMMIWEMMMMKPSISNRLDPDSFRQVEISLDSQTNWIRKRRTFKYKNIFSGWKISWQRCKSFPCRGRHNLSSGRKSSKKTSAVKKHHLTITITIKKITSNRTHLSKFLIKC